MTVLLGVDLTRAAAINSPSSSRGPAGPKSFSIHVSIAGTEPDLDAGLHRSKRAGSLSPRLRPEQLSLRSLLLGARPPARSFSGATYIYIHTHIYIAGGVGVPKRPPLGRPRRRSRS